MLLNLGMAHKQLEQLGHVTAAMVLVNAFQVRVEDGRLFSLRVWSGTKGRRTTWQRLCNRDRAAALRCVQPSGDFGCC